MWRHPAPNSLPAVGMSPRAPGPRHQTMPRTRAERPACKIGHMKIGFHLREAELKRVRRAARRRQMTVTEFVKEASLVWSSEDVSTRPAELNPFGRKAATMHRLAKR